LSGDYYAGSYNESTYAGRLLEAFRRIRALAAGQSDNKQRVRRIADFLARGGRPPAEVRVLDVGSGLCVFLAELKGYGYECHCVDPDPAAVEHALAHAGVDGAWAGILETFRTDLRFDLVTFNKVLEHVTDPVRLLRQARELLKPGGSIYGELPDGDLARRVGGVVERQEFFAEHYAVYGPGSLAHLARRAGFACSDPVSLREPSGKCTVFSFFSPA
ncbi:class I SAM-dependent methyltransferase, partial [bacterium]